MSAEEPMTTSKYATCGTKFNSPGGIVECTLPMFHTCAHGVLNAAKHGATDPLEEFCRHKEIDDEGFCKACKARTAIKIEGLRPPPIGQGFTLDMHSVQDADPQAQKVSPVLTDEEIARGLHEEYSRIPNLNWARTSCVDMVSALAEALITERRNLEAEKRQRDEEARASRQRNERWRDRIATLDKRNNKLQHDLNAAERSLAQLKEEQRWIPVSQYQDRMLKWGIRCFGAEHMADPEVRGLRLLEESIEFAQSVGVPKENCARLAQYVYSRPAGEPAQELGGVGVTWLVAASSLELTAEEVLAAEVTRVESKSPEHFTRRNQKKIDLGFRAAPAPPAEGS